MYVICIAVARKSICVRPQTKTEYINYKPKQKDQNKNKNEIVINLQGW